MTPPQPIEDWMTYREVARILLVTEGTIRNRMSRHKLPRVLVMVGRPPRRHHIARVPPETVRALARLLGTAPYL